MEKRKAHYKLEEIKKLIKAGDYSITATAKRTALQGFGFSEIEIISTIEALQYADLFKSMTSLEDPKIWHDVYKKNEMYIKLQIISKAIIISFKEA
jgi:motility quorum-sensing regulator/GCU-specific mRNA interferase toxin